MAAIMPAQGREGIIASTADKASAPSQKAVKTGLVRRRRSREMGVVIPTVGTKD